MSTSPDLESIRQDSLRSSERPGENVASRSSAESSLELLVSIEGKARAVESDQELHYFIANETRKLVCYRQAVVFTRRGKNRLGISAISSVAIVDRSAQFVLWLEELISRLKGSVSIEKLQEFTLSGYDSEIDLHLDEYPFDKALWVPFRNSRDGVFGGMLLLQERAWNDGQLVVAQRLGETYGHALAALQVARWSRQSKYRVPRKYALAIATAALLVLFIPVSLTTLAPVEVVAADPFISAAPINGVIEEVLVDPNKEVKVGDLLYRFVDTDFRNQFKIAEQDVRVSVAKLRRAKQLAFEANADSREIAILKAELDRSQLALAYAKEQLGQVEVKAKRSGIVLYGDRKDWVGKPVVIGEKILRVADPTQVEFRVDIPVKDSIVVKRGSRVRIYLDADPLSPLEAELVSASYHATELPGQILAYRSIAEVVKNEKTALRIGMRGTAKLYGDRVALFFYIFRRPISSLRQYIGI